MATVAASLVLRPPRRLRFAAGLAVVGALVAAGFGLNRLVPSASPLLWAMGLGVVVAPLAQARPGTAPGIAVSSRHLLRAGVALLGLRVSLSELASVGPGGLAVAAGTITATMGVTTLLGRRLGVPRALALLIATGSAICGASAIAAMSPVARARREQVGYAVATVTVFGTAAMLVIPILARALGLGDEQAGMWAGASIHEVAQATAAGAVISAAALKVATLVKLSRVVMLAPAVAIASARGGGEAPAGGLASARVPGFVLAFLALVALRSAAPLPASLLDAAATASTILLAAGLAGLGLGVRAGALRAEGLRPLVLGVAAWATAAVTALALVLLVG